MHEMFDKSQSLKFRLRAISLATLLSPFWFFGLIPPEVAKAQSRGTGCPAGTKVEGVSNSLVTNGYFTQQPAGPAPANTLFPGNWSSSVPYAGNNVYPTDTLVAIQTGAVNYADGIVQQVPFPGDAANGVPASNTWLYSNGNSTGERPAPPPPYTIWQQNIPTTSLQPNTTYVFYTYVSNAIRPGDDAPDDPVIQFLVNGIPLGESFTVFDDSDPQSGHNGQDLWDRKIVRFTTPASVPNPFTISIQDAATGSSGDDFGVVAIGVEACRPNIGIAKSVAAPVPRADGSFTIPYSMTVQNLAPRDANVPYTVRNVQVTDNLATTFAGATINSVGNIQSSSSSLTVNPSFNGQSNQNLLQGTTNDNLNGGESATITFEVNITPVNGNVGPFNNTARVSAIYPASPPGASPIADDSVNGTNTDPDGDLDPTNNSSPTPVTLTLGRRIGVAKQAGNVVNNSDGTYTVPYTVVVRNYGNVALNNVQVTDDLFGNANSTFNGATAVAISSPVTVSGALTERNVNFNGNSDRNFLTGTETLPIGGSATINFSVIVTPGSNVGSFNNTARAIATTPGNTTPVTDDSTDGVNPDLGGTVTANNNDGDPNNNNVPTPVSFNGTPNLRFVKRISNVFRNGVSLRGVNFNTFIDDPNDSNDNAAGWSQLAPRGVISLDSQAGLLSGDEVEYTLYFLSDGTQSIQNAKFCDLIPDDTAFVLDSFGAGSGVLLNLAGTNTSVTNAADTDRGSFLSVLSSLPAGNSCIDQANRNGAVIVNVGNLPQATGSNFGFIRFRVKLN